MALRLRRDVQKSSYYVWFLGAEEAKGLRGPRVISTALTYLVDQSNRAQEPIKVTLQISHKGIKIIQVCITTSSISMENKLQLTMVGFIFRVPRNILYRTVP